MRSFEISAREAGQRMDKYLRKMLSAASDGFIYKMLRKKNIVLNGKKASGSEMLKEGDEVRLYLSEETFAKFAPGAAVSFASETEGAGIDIVYEDDDILIMNKPAGMLSQKAKPDDDSANDRVTAYLLDSGQITREELLTFHPSVCNRLDRNTSGLLIAGKTVRGLQETAELLRGRDLKKYYHALVAGRIDEEQRLSGFLVKDEASNTVRVYVPEEISEPREACGSEDPAADSLGDPIETAWRPLSYYGNVTLLEIDLITGKSHQIRAHLASIGHPILGDPKYGKANLNNALAKATGIRSQLLCACRMEFPDGLNVEIPDPKEFERAEEWLES